MMKWVVVIAAAFLSLQLVLAQGKPVPGAPPRPQQPQQQPQQPHVPGQSAAQPPHTTAQPGTPPNPQVNANPGGVPLRADGEIALTSEGAGRRDPFTLPLYIINKLQVQNVPPPSRIDAAVDAIRRWPLVSYTLVGIIWDVKMSKALIRDQEGKMHILKIKDRIGYDNGVITDIREGSVTVLENQIPQVLKLKK